MSDEHSLHQQAWSLHALQIDLFRNCLQLVAKNAQGNFIIVEEGDIPSFAKKMGVINDPKYIKSMKKLRAYLLSRSRIKRASKKLLETPPISHRERSELKRSASA